MKDVDALLKWARAVVVDDYEVRAEILRLADALEEIITDTTSLLEEGATRIDALNRENQALAETLKARIT